MLIEAAYRKYSRPMQQSMTAFSRDEAAAKDAVSQAFTKGLMNRQMLEAMPEPAMKAWLYAAARNALIDYKRRDARLIPIEDPAFEGALPAVPDDRLLAEALLKKLPDHLRRPVYLKYYQGYNASEIGRMLALPPATVRGRIRTALLLMRRMAKP